MCAGGLGGGAPTWASAVGAFTQRGPDGTEQSQAPQPLWASRIPGASQQGASLQLPRWRLRSPSCCPEGLSAVTPGHRAQAAAPELNSLAFT